MIKLRRRVAPLLRHANSGAWAVLLATTLHGCSSQQLYAAGQSWQRVECNKIVDSQERSRCMASASHSYEEYKRESESNRAGK